MAQAKSDVLLESGTNELEVVMFHIDTSLFGINVLKVREIIHAIEVTAVPNSHVNVEGVIRLRDEVIPVVHLAKMLGFMESKKPAQDKFIIAELNQMKVAFRVHHVSRIYRISWEQIDKPNELSAGEEAYATGIIKLEDQMAILLDFEKIIVEIEPKSGVNLENLEALGNRKRSQKKIIVAEDSAMLRALLKETLTEAGYERLTFFENGKEAWDYVEHLAQDQTISIEEEIDLIVTDIEMPQMDGHHFTDRIKKNTRLNHIPVIIFSSLITDELFYKGEKVGADAQVSKPGIMTLVQTIDRLVTDKRILSSEGKN